MRYSQSGILKDTRPWGKMFVAGAAAVTLAVAMFASAFAAGTTVVTPSSLNGWTSEAGGGGSSSFVNDAGATNGSALQLVTPDSNDAYVEYYHDVNLPLSQVDNLSYMAKTVSGPAAASASYAIGIDTSDADTATNFYYVYEPYWQVNFGGQALVANTWQTWDVDSGEFWKSGSGTTEPSYNWNEIISENSGASVSTVVIYMGTYNRNYTVNVDSVVVNDDTYDFQVDAADVVKPSVPENLGWTSPAVACGGQTNSYTITANWDDSTDNVGVTGYKYEVMTPARDTWAEAYVTNVASSQYNGAFTEGEGVYTYRVSAVDAAGNVSDPSVECTVNYDTTPKVLSAQDCKNGGYKNVYTETNGIFKNQGSCVSYVQASDNASFKRDNQ